MYRIYQISDGIIVSSTSWEDPVLAIEHLNEMLEMEDIEVDASMIREPDYSWHYHVSWDVTWQIINEED